MNKEYTLDGETIDILEFLKVNAENFDVDTERREIGAMKVGDERFYGGGAFAVFILKRVK